MKIKTISTSQSREGLSQSLSEWRPVLIMIFLLAAVALVAVSAALLSTPGPTTNEGLADEAPASNPYSTNPEIWTAKRLATERATIDEPNFLAVNPEISVVRRFRETQTAGP